LDKTPALLTRLRHASRYAAAAAIAGAEAGAAPVDVRIGSLRLRSVYEPFARCMRGPSAYGWAELERSRIEYAPAAFELAPADQQRLQEVARYALADRAVERIYVDGHTDDVGGAPDNLELSRRRAETVRDALVAFGVPAERVVVRYHGARYPVAGNDQEAGRSQNRRSTVRLERRDPGEDELASR